MKKFHHPRRSDRFKLSGFSNAGGKTRRYGRVESIARLWTALSLLTLNYPSAVRGDPPPKPDLLNLSLDELSAIKIDTVYAASKFTEKVTDAPSSVTIIGRDEIQRFGYRTLGDIIESVRSFDIRYDRNYSYTGIRGFNSLGDYGSRVL